MPTLGCFNAVQSVLEPLQDISVPFNHNHGATMTHNTTYEHLTALLAEHPDIQLSDRLLQTLDDDTAVKIPLDDGSCLSVIYTSATLAAKHGL